MIRHYLMTTYRSAKKEKTGFFINTLGLMAGFLVFIGAFAFVEHEKSYDHFFEKADQIVSPVIKYRPGAFFKTKGVFDSYYPALTKEALESFPEIIASAVVTKEEWPVKINNDYFKSKMAFTNPDFFKMFELNFLSGGMEKFGDFAEATIISEQQAIRLFGKTDVVGETFLINDTVSANIIGVYESLPLNSHFTGLDDGPDDLGMLINNLLLNQLQETTYLESWRAISSGIKLYFLLKEGTGRLALTKDIDALTRTHLNNPDEHYFDGALLTPLTEINLMYWTEGEFSFLTLVQGIGILILLLAVLNSISLNSARMMERSKEIAIRRISGASRTALIRQLVSENIILSALSTLMAIVLVYFVLQKTGELTGRLIEIGPLLTPEFIIFLVVSAILVGILSTLYPILLLSGWIKGLSLTRSMNLAHSASKLRKVLAGVQFTFVCSLVLALIVMTSQNEHLRNSTFKFPFEKIVTLQGFYDPKAKEIIPAFINELRKNPAIENTTLTNKIPLGGNTNIDSFYRHNLLAQEDAISIQLINMDEQYLSLFNIPLLSGRNIQDLRGDDIFTREEQKSETSISLNVLINETAVQQLDFENTENALGKTFLQKESDELYHTMRVIGVVPDIRLGRQNLAPRPMIFSNREGRISSIGISYKNPKDIDLDAIRKLTDEFFPGTLPDIKTLAMGFEDAFKDFNSIFNGILVLIGITFTLAVAGLYALSSYLATSKAHEVGIRKTLGARSDQIVRLYLWQFSKPVFWALAIGLPLGLYGMGLYLNEFSTRISLTPTIVLETIAATLVICWTTIIWHIMRAARAHPSNVLE